MIKNHSSNEIQEIILQVRNTYIHLVICEFRDVITFTGRSMLSASEMIFRQCLSIAELFIQNWLYFPIPITIENVNRVYDILSQDNEATVKSFSFSLLEEILVDYMCIKQVLVEIMRFVVITFFYYF